MYRRFADPAERTLANRWMAANVAVYGTLLLAILAVLHLSSSSGQPSSGQVAQALASAAAIAHSQGR